MKRMDIIKNNLENRRKTTTNLDNKIDDPTQDDNNSTSNFIKKSASRISNILKSGKQSSVMLKYQTKDELAKSLCGDD